MFTPFELVILLFLNNHNFSVALCLFTETFSSAEPALMWIKLNTQKERDTKCPPVRMAYTNCPVSHGNIKYTCICITWYEWLDKSQRHCGLSIRSRSCLPSPLELAGDCAHSLANTLLEGDFTSAARAPEVASRAWKSLLRPRFSSQAWRTAVYLLSSRTHFPLLLFLKI